MIDTLLDDSNLPMAEKHLIRLRGPWEVVPLAHTMLAEDGRSIDEPGEVPAAGRLQMPADWSSICGPDFHGRVAFTRWFHRPTNLDPWERVYLMIDEVDALAKIDVNGHAIGEARCGGGPVMFDITEELADRNQLCIEVDLPRVPAGQPELPRGERHNLPGGLVGEVRLEIFSGRI